LLFGVNNCLWSFDAVGFWVLFREIPGERR
jgi:hypothetical protein